MIKPDGAVEEMISLVQRNLRLLFQILLARLVMNRLVMIQFSIAVSLNRLPCHLPCDSLTVYHLTHTRKLAWPRMMAGELMHSVFCTALCILYQDICI